MKKKVAPEISPKNTKDQIFAAYSEVLEKLNEREPEIPQEVQKRQEDKAIVARASAYSPDAIISDLSGIKLKAIKQLDVLSEELLREFQKLTDIRQAIESEKKHLEELYQIKETSNTLAALFQTYTEQKAKLEQERDTQKQDFEQFMTAQRLHWTEENERLERDFQEKKEKREKDYKREEEEYVYTRDMSRRKEMDDFHAKKIALEKELAALRDDLQKREAALLEKEKTFSDLQSRVDQFPDELKKAIAAAEETLRAQILHQSNFESQIKQKELDGQIRFHDLQVASLQGKIKEQELLLKELSQRADQATEKVQVIACRALDASSPRFIQTSNTDDKGAPHQK